jgi:hypothetical protein
VPLPHVVLQPAAKQARMDMLVAVLVVHISRLAATGMQRLLQGLMSHSEIGYCCTSSGR